MLTAPTQYRWVAILAGVWTSVINKDSSGCQPQKIAGVASSKVENSLQGYRNRNPLCFLSASSTRLLCSLSPFLLLFLSQGQNSGEGHLLLGKLPKKTNLAPVMPLPVSWGMSPQVVQFDITPRYTEHGNCSVAFSQFRRSYGGILEICGTILVVSD